MITEQFHNSSITTLSGAISDVATSLVVAAASNFPTKAQFRILIGSEIMLVTGVSGTTFTVSRAQEGTVAAAHADGATVSGILTAGALGRFAQDIGDILDSNIILRPEHSAGTQSTAAGDVTLSGASYFIFRHIDADRILFRVTAATGGGVMRVALYQADKYAIPGSDPVLLCDAIAPAGYVGNVEVTVPEFTLCPGIIFALFGKQAGTTTTIRTYANNSMDLFDTNVQANYHPVAFTTAFASTTLGAPATINPLTDLTPSAANVIPIIRLRKA
jgi:hypothetical protein